MGLRMKPIREYGLIGGGYTFQSIMKSHELLGHPSIKSTRKTAQMMNFKLTGIVTRCKDCILAKVKRTNTKKFNENKSKRKGGRLCVDISWVKRSSLGNNKYWLIIEDEFTSMKWSFLLIKNRMLEIKLWDS